MDHQPLCILKMYKKTTHFNLQNILGFLDLIEEKSCRFCAGPIFLISGCSQQSCSEV